MNKVVANLMLREMYPDIETFSALYHTFDRMAYYFGNHANIMISVSGGADSDCIVHLVCTYFPEYIDKCHFVFCDTGLEFQATKEHIQYLREHYNIDIKKVRGESVVYACKKYGVPILNKTKAHYIDMYMRRTPKAHYLVFEANEPHMHFKFTEKERELVRYLDKTDIKVSSKCCDVSKKKPLKDYAHKNYIDLNVTGERKAEGGPRATAHHSCFEEQKEIDKFMPLFWWTNKIKADFEKTEGIVHSRCYTEYGMKRTGCTGCPFGRDTPKELEILKKYEPQLFRAVKNVFGESYRLTDRFDCRKKKFKIDEK